MKTILLGDRSDLDKDLKNLFQEGGILHILTISGMHISMLGMGSFRLLRKAGASQKVSAVAGIGIILLYGAMIGTQAATFRAICMFALQMAAILTGRTYDRLTGLSVAAVLLLLERPLYVFYSGFLLSFGAVLGVTVVSPLLEKLCKNKSAWVKWFCKLFSGGIGILLATFPVQLYFYYEYSIYSMLVNVLVLPLLPYIVGLGLAVLAIPQVTAVLTVPVVLGCEGLLRIFEWVCIQSQKLPFHSLVLGAPKGWQIVCYYGCLAICVGCLNRIAAGNTGKLNAIEYFKKYKLPGILSFGTFLASVIILLWRPVEGLTCRFLSVGQGDCAVMQYGSETYVVDCGSTSSSNVGTQILLPCLKYYGVSEVDGVFISHADADHMNGIVQWLEEYEHSHVQIGSIILPSLTKEALSEEFGELIEAAGLWNIPVVSLGAGDELMSKIICTGAQARPGKFYQAMDVFLFPSLWEGLPMSVVEAQAAGLPCLISDTITKNVLLTSLVSQHSLKRSAEEWAELVFSKSNKKRTSCSVENAGRLKQFDSKLVAGQLQEFYRLID